ncbi:sulfotransferase [Sphingosinicella sp. CPCC 101087]|uniref:sulfotransferase family protein n=1 Tax=Sphingosinicella sp. CPCC 101087 TaxID=2497754 RepID=UPI00101B79D2|nr:sulfotransferase [Sphingosinicella sp. CPCC 101087]
MTERLQRGIGIAGRPALTRPQRPMPFRAANGFLDLLWKSRLASPPELSVESLEHEARLQAELDDFGDPWFRDPLRILLESLVEEAELNPIGRMVARIHCRKLLRERLWTMKWLRDHPEIRQRPIAEPIVVVGPMRSGTTRLHRLLAADDRFAHLKLFETICPVPEPPVLNGHGPDPRAFVMNGHDPRPKTAARFLALLHRANPATAIVHPTGPREPEEELGLLVASAWGMKHEAQWRVPSYAHWCEQADAAPAYAHMADLLRLTGWLRKDDPARPWLLKTPQHMLDLPALLKVFPDARIIFIHRDPAAVVGSSCSMVWNQMRVQSDKADPGWIGREWMRKTRLKIDRMTAARTQIPKARMIDVHYDEMERDWRSVMERIYRFLDRDMAPAWPAMAAYIAGTEANRSFRSHVYHLASFGLEAGEVREAFADYVEAFAVPLGPDRSNGKGH